MIDCHIHTYRCSHGRGDFEDYIEGALNKQLKIIGFSEHGPFIYDPTNRMDLEATREYFNILEGLKNKYSGKIRILSGIELDYSPKAESQIRDITNKFNFDFILGAVHFLESDEGRIALWDHRKMQRKDNWDKYFEELNKASLSKLFDVIAHPDLILACGIPREKIDRQINNLVLTMRENGIAYEINCSGISKGTYDPGSMAIKECPSYPDLKSIQFAYNLNIPLVIGSDAHKPEDTGKNVDIMLKKLKEAGIDKINYIENRKLNELNI